MNEDKQKIIELEKQINQLNAELNETYRSVTQLTNSLEITNKERLMILEQVQRAQKLESLGIMAGGIAHDYNNILTAILGYTELALQNLASDSFAHHCINQVEKESKRAEYLTKQMLAYLGYGAFEVGPININKVLHETARIMENTVFDTVVMKYELCEDIPDIEANFTQINQIVTNLIINASEAIGDANGYITVSTGVKECDETYLSESYIEPNPEPGSFVWLQVSDTGCGMDKETLKKLCDPFFTTKFIGRGLGMSALHGITKGHRGAMMAGSEPGKGTTIRLLYPVYESPEELNEKQQEESAAK